MWKPEDFDGITETRVKSTEIWIPDFSLYNSYVMAFSLLYLLRLYQSTVVMFNLIRFNVAEAKLNKSTIIVVNNIGARACVYVHSYTYNDDFIIKIQIIFFF